MLAASPELGGSRIYKKVRTVFDMRWDRLERQTRDVSCAAASLATLRTHYFRQRTGEEDAVRDLLRVAQENGTLEQARRSGFSMLDMRNYLEAHGFEAQGFAADVKALESLPIPVIVLVEIRGFPHYVVLKGVREGMIYLADPLFGNISMKVTTFSRSWEGVFLAGIRKGKPLPVFNPLGVRREDQIAVGDEDVDRVANREFVRFGILRLPTVRLVSTVPVTPIPGLRSIVPAVLNNSVEFRGWGG